MATKVTHAAQALLAVTLSLLSRLQHPDPSAGSDDRTGGTFRAG